MSGRFLLDTNIVIAIFAEETAVLERAAAAGEVFVPAVALGELYYGARKSGRSKTNIARIDEFAAAAAVVGCDAVTAQQYGRIKNDLRAKGRPIPENDIWIGAVVSAQMKGGRYTEKAEDTGSVRGETIFAGKLDWAWDATPETSFRYSVPIPLEKFAKSPAQYYVVDTLIVIPRPGKVTREEIDSIMSKVYELKDPAAIAGYLDGYKDRFSYYLPPTGWNVKGGAS